MKVSDAQIVTFKTAEPSNTYLTLDHNIFCLELPAPFPCQVILECPEAKDQTVI